MATLYVTEYSAMAPVGYGVAPLPAGVVANQTVAIAGASAASSVFNGKTFYIRVHCDVTCSIAIGNSATATTSSARMAAGQTEYFGVGQGERIAVISNT